MQTSKPRLPELKKLKIDRRQYTTVTLNNRVLKMKGDKASW